MNYLRGTLAVLICLGLCLAVWLLLVPTSSLLPQDDSRPVPPLSLAMAEGLAEYADPDITMASDRYRPIPPDEKLFTVSRQLRPVVDFWKRVYTGIYSFQAIVHDSYDVTRVYAVVDLRDEPGDLSSSNAARRVVRRYRDHLEFLTTADYRASELSGERKRLHAYIISNGGLAEFAKAAGRVRIQRGLRDTFKQGLIHSGRYLEQYRKIFRDHGLPEELTLLPHLESSYQFNARSHAAAVGIWQLTRGASERLINIHSTVDERIDPFRSAEAAAKILRYNYNKLKTWPLAITAYNQGAYGMARAVRIVGTRDIDQIIRKYRGRSYGFAGRNFYCAYVAVLEVVHDFEKYFGALDLDQPQPFRQHKLTRSATLSDVATKLGVEERVLADLNPHLRSRGVRSQARLPRGTALNLPEEEIVE